MRLNLKHKVFCISVICNRKRKYEFSTRTAFIYSTSLHYSSSDDLNLYSCNRNFRYCEFHNVDGAFKALQINAFL